jgi:hypothetical protein
MQNGAVLLPSHTLVFRVHTRVFLTLFVALGVAATFLTQLIQHLN